jgi:hypothetical protein
MLGKRVLGKILFCIAKKLLYPLLLLTEYIILILQELDAQVKELNNNLLNGDAFTHSEYITEFGTNLLTSEIVGRVAWGTVARAASQDIEN